MKGVYFMKTQKELNPQCESCYCNASGNCLRIGLNGNKGVCWMERTEGEY